jgi:polyhydroxyalkanoate synthase
MLSVPYNRAMPKKVMENLSEMMGNQAAGRSLRAFPVHIAMAQTSYAKLKMQNKDAEAPILSMLKGIQKYQNSNYQRVAQAYPVIWQNGSVSVSYIKARGEAQSALILIPSLINGPEIFDILPERSFVRFLSDQGVDIYVLSWGHSLDDNALFQIDSLITERLIPAIQFVAEQTSVKLNALGYCMGGTLLAATVPYIKEYIDKFVFLAAPWDFHAGDQALVSHIKNGAPAALNLIQTQNCLPVDWIQSVFAQVNEGRTVEKFQRFAEMEGNSPEAILFVAVEDWLNSGNDLPAGIAKTCIDDWYLKNLPMKNEWVVKSQAVSVSDYDINALIIASPRDLLVPFESSIGLHKQLGNSKIWSTDLGHIGMMISQNAHALLWAPLVAELNAAPQ